MEVTAAGAVGMCEGRLGRIHGRLRDYVEAGHAPGFVTLVARDGQVVHLECCGYRDVEARLPMREDTIFRIYSMTKPITSVALMMLYERGKFQLHDPVSRFIPAFGRTRVLRGMGFLGKDLVPQETPMTAHHLLTHTAGLSYGFYLDSPIEDMYRNSIFHDPTATLAEKIVGMADLPLRHQPGEGWNYSIATDVCGYLVEVLADMPFEDFLRDEIFAPLGMDDTGFHVAGDKVDRFARLYQHNISDGSFREFNGGPDIPAYDFTQPAMSPSGGGGLVSTIGDYWRFARVLHHGGAFDGVRLISRKTLEYMARNHLRADLLPINIGLSELSGKGFGLGFDVIMDAAQTGVLNSDGAYGWSGAAATNFWVDPQEGIVGIIMTQLMNNMHNFQQDFRALTYQALVD